jgi:hypothetical protein
MTKREQAAQLLKEMKDIAAGDAVAMNVVKEMEGEYASLATKQTEEEDFKFELFVKAHLTYKVYDKSPERKLLLEKKVDMKDYTNLSIPSHCHLETYLWVNASLTDTGAWDREHANFTVSYTSVFDINKKGKLLLLKKYSQPLGSTGGSTYTIFMEYDAPKSSNSIQLKIKGLSKSRKETKKHWSGGKETEYNIPEGTMASRILNATFLPQAYQPKTFGTKELVFENENQAVLSSDKLDTLHLWWNELNPNLRYKIENREAIIWITGYTSKSGTDEYNYQLGEDRARYCQQMLHKIIGKGSNGEGLAIINIRSMGEYQENTSRYVIIKVIDK